MNKLYITPKQTQLWQQPRHSWEHFLIHYGWPDSILTDQGKSFENNLMNELCALANVTKLRMNPYRPETNGWSECFNQILINMIGTLPAEDKLNWPDWVSTLTHAYNCTPTHFTGFSPYFLMFGTHPRLGYTHRIWSDFTEFD